MKSVFRAFTVCTIWTTFILFSGCASEPKHGFGPVELTWQQQKYFEKYLNRYAKRKVKQSFWALAISPTQSYATYSVSWGGPSGDALRRSQERAIENCNEEIRIKDCKIYAINGEVVWKFDEPAPIEPGVEPAAKDQSSAEDQIKYARDQLSVIQKLLKQGLISEEEAEKKRKKILDDL